MNMATYPFAAVVGQSEIKLALLLAAVDWRLGVLLRGDKGSGKTTSARALAALLPSPAPFINVPIGVTEDRLLGGLHLERALAGDPVLKPGLLSDAHGGVLYVDEINLLPAHLGDALLDTAASGINLVEREGLSASTPAEFVFLGSMNPEEGTLRPQLLDRFALSVDVSAPLDPVQRQTVLERRRSFERDPGAFAEAWSQEQQTILTQIARARACLDGISCSTEVLGQISTRVCKQGVRSLRADLAAMRAAIAYAALRGEEAVDLQHVATVLPLVLAHRDRDRTRQSNQQPVPSPQVPPAEPNATRPNTAQAAIDHIFAPATVETLAIYPALVEQRTPEGGAAAAIGTLGTITGARKCDTPAELDLRATLNHTLRATGSFQAQISDLHERVRAPRTSTRFLFVVDSSGSQAAQQRMRLVKGAIAALLTRSFKRGDEAAIIVFRGTAADVLVEPTRSLSDALAALEYVPTGGRTPLAHALDLARSYVTPSTLLLLLTDGRANVPLGGTDAWEDALQKAEQIHCAALLVDTTSRTEQTVHFGQLAGALQARCTSLEDLMSIEALTVQVDWRAAVPTS
jgi:magnesium chelatase subunit D